MKSLGTSLFGTPKVVCTSGFACGVVLNRLPSARTPYWICTRSAGRQASPSEKASVATSPERRAGTSRRVNEAGSPASRSASELNVNVPREFAFWSWMKRLTCRSSVSLIRCELSSVNQDVAFDACHW